MTDSNKKPASAAPGKPAGRDTKGSSQDHATPGTPTGVPASEKAAAKAGAKPAARPGAKAPAKPGTKPGNKPVTRKAGPGKTGLRAAAKAKAKAKARGDVPAAKPAQPVISEATTAARRALAWTHTARFFTTASQLRHLPRNGVMPGEEVDASFEEEIEFAEDPSLDPAAAADGVDQDSAVPGVVTERLPPRPLPEIAFVGRSNAGKSTAINTLAQQKRLAFASKTPGRTQHINLFSVGPKDAPNALFADLPGYGYAAVARDAKLRWQRVMADYLGERETLSGVVLMVDSRLGLTELDKQLLEFVSDRVTGGEISLLVLLTKADKLNRKEASAALMKVEKELAVLATEDSDIAITLFSALNKQGLDDVAEQLYEWAHREPRVLRDDDGYEVMSDGSALDDAAASPTDQDDQDDQDDTPDAPEAPVR